MSSTLFDTLKSRNDFLEQLLCMLPHPEGGVNKCVADIPSMLSGCLSTSARKFKILNNENRRNLSRLVQEMDKKGLKPIEYGQFGEILFWALRASLGSHTYDRFHSLWVKLVSQLLNYLVHSAVSLCLKKSRATHAKTILQRIREFSFTDKSGSIYKTRDVEVETNEWFGTTDGVSKPGTRNLYAFCFSQSGRDGATTTPPSREHTARNVMDHPVNSVCKVKGSSGKNYNDNNGSNEKRTSSNSILPWSDSGISEQVASLIEITNEKVSPRFACRIGPARSTADQETDSWGTFDAGCRRAPFRDNDPENSGHNTIEEAASAFQFLFTLSPNFPVSAKR
jgi:hypothetical protein